MSVSGKLDTCIKEAKSVDLLVVAPHLVPGHEDGDVMEGAKLLTIAAAASRTSFLFIFPEDLHTKVDGRPLVSPFQDEDFMADLRTHHAISVVVRTCAVAGGCHEIPLRLVSSMPGLSSLGLAVGSTFDCGNRDKYQGPVPARCAESGRRWLLLPKAEREDIARQIYGARLCRSLADVIRDSFAPFTSKIGTRPKAKARPRKPQVSESIPQAVGLCRAEPILLDVLSMLNLPGGKGFPGQGPTSEGGAACVGLSAFKGGDSFALQPFLNAFTMENKRAVKRINEAMQRDRNFPSDFTYSSIQTNGPDCQAQGHEDRNNLGLSLIVGLGRYEGGELEILLDSKWSKVNIRGRYVLFDGSITHRTADFEGDRHSLVLFTHKCVQRAQEAQLLALRQLGFRLAKPDEHCSSPEAETSDDDSDGLRRRSTGTGNTGDGPPLFTGSQHRRKPFHDGAGLSSASRWPPEAPRADPTSLANELRHALLALLHSSLDVPSTLAALACSRCSTSPFSVDVLEKGQALVGSREEAR